jgi:hypothetical protein
LTGENKWLQRAADFAQRAFTYRKADEEGVSWGADEEGFYSPDFMCGAAGTGPAVHAAVLSYATTLVTHTESPQYRLV